MTLKTQKPYDLHIHSITCTFPCMEISKYSKTKAMKKLTWIIFVLICTCVFHTCNAQTQLSRLNYAQLVSFKKIQEDPIKRETYKAVKFTDLTDREQYLLLSKLEDAYYLFHKKEVDTNVLLIYMQENNPTCEWNGLHEEFEDGKLIRVWTIHRKYTLEIFDL